MNQATARIQFADWLKRTHPAIYAKAINAATAQEAVQGLGETAPSGSFWQKFSDAAMGLGTTYLALKNQRDAMKINLERAQQGMPPIDAGSTAPVVRTQVQIDPVTADKLASTAGEGINKTLLLAGVAIAAFLYLGKKRR